MTASETGDESDPGGRSATPAMIHAGVMAYLLADPRFATEAEIVENIYERMISAREGELTPP